MKEIERERESEREKKNQRKKNCPSKQDTEEEEEEEEKEGEKQINKRAVSQPVHCLPNSQQPSNAIHPKKLQSIEIINSPAPSPTPFFLSRLSLSQFNTTMREIDATKLSRTQSDT